MIPQNAKIAPILFIAIVTGVFVFSLYVFLITENTVIVVNEAAAEPEEVFIAGNNTPETSALANQIQEEVVPAQNPKLRILETGIGFLNVREGPSIGSKQVDRVLPGETYEYVVVKDNWYQIVHPEIENAWVSGQYVKVEEE